MESIKKLCVVSCPIATRSGYGSRSRDFVRALLKEKGDEWDIKILSQRWGNLSMNALTPDDNDLSSRIINNLEQKPDIWFQITIPSEFQPVGHFNVGVSAVIESSDATAEFIEGCNRMDLNIVSSEHSKTTLKAVYDKLNDQTKEKVGELKIEKPVEVLFEGYDTEIYDNKKPISKTVEKTLSEIPEQFCFLFVGHWLSGNLGEDRKDIGMMLKVFYTMFKNKKNPPALILKTSGAGFSIMDRNEMMKKIRLVKDTMRADKLPNVYLLHGDLTDEEMNQLYNHPKVKAHVSFTHGEGFGRPLLEASLSGKPMIAPIATGQADFLHKEYTVELPHAMTKVPAGAFPKDYGNPEAEWATVNYGVAGKLIQDVYENYDKYKLKAKKQMIVNKETFSHEAMKEKLDDIISPLISKIPQPVELKLPSLKKEPKKLKLPTLKKG